MSNTTGQIPVANDGFERYYAEKIWEWIPAIYRHEDGLADPPHVLRGIVEVLARQSAHARRTTDRLWEDPFIDTCDDWAIPYIGHLVGTRLLGNLNRRGQRADVARTIYYRRRKGTPVVMEALIQDITGWEGAVVESFKRLTRARHRLDPEPAPLAGEVTRTPPGGTAKLRAARTSEILDGPFDDLAHTPDFRQLEGFQGRYNIPKLNFFLYRLVAYEASKVTPYDFGNQRFTFDPSGRETPLFRPDKRQNLDQWSPAEEWQLPAPISCRMLNQFKDELVPDAVSLSVDDDGDSPLDESAVAAGLLDLWSAPAPGGLEAVIDPHRGRFLLTNPPGSGEHAWVNHYHYGFSGPTGAGPFARTGLSEKNVTDVPDVSHPGPVDGFSLQNDDTQQFTTSKTYQPTAPSANTVSDIANLILQAPSGQRPYLTLIPDGGNEWILQGASSASTLVLDGLWLGLVHQSDCPDGMTLVLDGQFDCVVIRHCTLDPGGRRARSDPGICRTIPAVTLELRGQVDELIVESSILGPVVESTSDADPCSAGKITIRDSIVQNRFGATALETRVAEVSLERVTIFGDVSVNRLDATEALIQGTVKVLDNQHGCFRFSASNASPDRRLPKQFESHLFAPEISNHFFTSPTFGHPGYAQLSATAPETIVRGAENRAEMGAFNELLNPIKRDDLESKVLEFMPFGLIPQFIFET